jgi:universal stress protein E
VRTVRQILVAVKDPSLPALPGVEKAAQLAGACKAGLELFHAMATPVHVSAIDIKGDNLTHFLETERSRALDRLEAIAGRLRRRGIPVTVSFETDFPAYEAIIRRAGRIGADLIVADCHEGRHVAASLLRLTDWELLRHSPVPVLLIKNRRPYRQPVLLAALDPSHAFAKPSDLDDEILRAATTLTKALDGKLHAVHAYPSLVPVAPVEFRDVKTYREHQREAKAAAEKRVERLLRNSLVTRPRRHLLAQSPIVGIPSVARSTRASIVVMGAISRSGLKRLFIGNTAERVLDAIECDVLIVKPRGFASRVQRRNRGVRFSTSSFPVY